MFLLFQRNKINFLITYKVCYTKTLRRIILSDKKRSLWSLLRDTTRHLLYLSYIRCLKYIWLSTQQRTTLSTNARRCFTSAGYNPSNYLSTYLSETVCVVTQASLIPMSSAYRVVSSSCLISFIVRWSYMFI